MQTIQDINKLRSALFDLRAGSATIALVPTMGALHAGHLALVDAAKAHADHVVVSIFVNPKQFGPREDFSHYPRQIEKDAALLRTHGVAMLWQPSVETMYPAGFGTNVSVAKLGDGLCGAARPGHFDGVATVVAKLFAQVRPNVAVFGEKDWQQLAIVSRMAQDLDSDVTIVRVPIMREDDGLALSSRNAYLSTAHRQAALALPRALAQAAAAIAAGGDVIATLAHARAQLKQAGFDPIDYVALVDSASLEPVYHLAGEARLLAAAKLGSTRLIDNLGVSSKK
ncbi:MAG: pantoate--beta-alanine ligase [Sphingomonadaceae bacterium]